jgi:glycosyltransferase involved in cell wall biosynthesis
VERTAVFHLITELDIGGAQLALLRLLASLDRDRFVPTVACLYNGDAAVAQRIRALGVPVTDLGMTARWRWDAFERLYRLLRHERPTILHTWMFHANLPGRVLGALARVPIIITSRRNENIGGVMREYLNRWTACLDDRVIAVCELARQAEIKRARVSPEHVVTVYNGVDVERFSVAGGRPSSLGDRHSGRSATGGIAGAATFPERLLRSADCFGAGQTAHPIGPALSGRRWRVAG